MWIERLEKTNFINSLLKLDKQVLIVRGPRQVGKTSFIENCLNSLPEYQSLSVNLLNSSTVTLSGKNYFGRDFFGKDESGEEFIKNIKSQSYLIKDNPLPAIVFIDEVDRYPSAMESIQLLASYSDNYKFILTGSNLENLSPKNSATGRKRYFDLYPVSFKEFLVASNQIPLKAVLEDLSTEDTNSYPTSFAHDGLSRAYLQYLRLGGMPKVLTCFLENQGNDEIARTIQDLTLTIEENIKTILDEKIAVYEYHDFLRVICRSSLNTLKITKIQTNHINRREAIRLLAKSVGARVAHKIRLWDSENDLSKYLIFDTGIANFLLAGADILNNRLIESELAIMHETGIANSIIPTLSSRDNLFYWKSENQAEVEFSIKSPSFIGIDVKATQGNLKSLKSMANIEAELNYIVKISSNNFSYTKNFSLNNQEKERTIKYISLPHYAASELVRLTKD